MFWLVKYGYINPIFDGLNMLQAPCLSAPELQLCAAGGSGHRTHHLRPREAPRPWQTQRGPRLGQLWRFRDVEHTVAIQGCRILIHEDHGF